MPMQPVVDFYDTYHAKNGVFKGSISEGNFTYYYLAPVIRRVLQSLYRPVVLDIGCGVGTLSLFAAQYAHAVIGIDVSARAVAIAQAAIYPSQRVFFKQGTLSAPVQVASCIICCEVLEHVPHDEQFLYILRDSLIKGGILILSTPLQETVLASTRLYKHFDAEVGHLRRYSVTQLRSLFARVGFEIVELHRTESPLRNLLFILHMDLVIRCIRGPLVPFFHWVDEQLCWVFGASNAILVARKK